MLCSVRFIVLCCNCESSNYFWQTYVASPTCLLIVARFHNNWRFNVFNIVVLLFGGGGVKVALRSLFALPFRNRYELTQTLCCIFLNMTRLQDDENSTSLAPTRWPISTKRLKPEVVKTTCAPSITRSKYSVLHYFGTNIQWICTHVQPWYHTDDCYK